MKTHFLILVFIFSAFISFGQNPITVVDGFFLKMSKNSAIEQIGYKNIQDTSLIKPDSARTLIGKNGEYGLFIIRTKDPGNPVYFPLRSKDNLFFDQNPAIIINDTLMTGIDLNTIDPMKVDSIQIISPLTAVTDKGIAWAGGIIKIWKKK